jgi:RHS repeat-associated protein
VSQGGQANCQIGSTWYSRCFSYDSLRRLTTANNPESGITSYTYDNNGNLVSKTAGGIISCFGNLSGQTCDGSGYDGLNRPTFKSFSDGTPSVTWLWDTVQKGRLSSVTSIGSTTSSTTSFSGYDLLGRPTANAQATPANSSPYNFTYTYVPAGISSIHFPSGRIVNYSYDIAGRLLSVAGSATYASSIAYVSHGGLASFTLGNNKVEQTCYNNRLQPAVIRLGTSTSTNCVNTSGADLLNLNYNYGTTNNNGNVQSQIIVRPVGTWTQSYGYDGLNRLTSGSESGTGSWSESFGYDGVGNRWIPAPPSGLPPLTNETPKSQSWYLPNNRISGWGYDGAGNLTSIANVPKTFTYDAENRMKSATVSSTTTSYVYDGEGRRVQKIGPSGTTTYVYDAAGQLAAEYGTPTDSDTGTRFLTSDHLGSTRLKTDSTGAVTNCYDYLPFGEEIALNTAGRTASCFAPAGTDTFNIKLTGTQRDAETGLDYFEARYFSGTQGRFTSPDPGNTGAFPSNPQSWNSYGYVVNNPLRYTDPHGTTVQVCDANGQNCRDLSDQEFRDFRHDNHRTLSFYGGMTGSIYDGDTFVGTFKQTDVDITSPVFPGLVRGMHTAAPVVNTLAAVTLAFLTAAGGFGAYGVISDTGVLLIPGLAPTAEYVAAIKALDLLGKINPNVALTINQVRALAQNAVDVLTKTIPNALKRGDAAGVQSVMNQLANPRFKFLDQIPGPLREELARQAGRLGITIK